MQRNRLTSRTFLQPLNWLKRNRSFGVFVLLPWALISIYLGLIKAPEYESTASVLIGHTAQSTPKNRIMAFFNKKKHFIPGDETTPLFLIQKYIYSDAMLFELQKGVDIKSHYQSRHVDIISRLKKNPNQKELLQYYLKKVNVSNDASTGELIVSVRAFSPEKAQEYLGVIMQKATRYLSDVMSAGMREESRQVEHQLEVSRKKLVAAEMAYDLGQSKNKGRRVQRTKAIEQDRLALRFAEAEYDAAQKAYVLWHMSSTPHQPVNTSLPNLPDYVSYPNIPYDLLSLLVLFSVIFLLGKMIQLVIHEHID